MFSTPLTGGNTRLLLYGLVMLRSVVTGWWRWRVPPFCSVVLSFSVHCLV